MKILFINLADQHVLGEKAVKALKIKHGEGIYQFDWVNIALSLHEEQNDRQNAFSEIQFGDLVDKLLDHSQLAEFIDTMLVHWKYPDNNYPIQIILSICYAARTAEYTKDDIADAGNLDFKETFAYKFLTALQEKLQIRNCFNEIILKAYTGAVSFNEVTGELLVQQYYQLIKKRTDLLMAEKLPQPNYGEVIYRAKERGVILIDTNNLTQRLVDQPLTVENMPREQPAAAPLLCDS